MSARKVVSSSGSGKTPQQKRKRRAACSHHWILENTKYPIIKGSGQSNLGTTKSRCKKCGKSSSNTSATPDSIHGMESLVASNIRSEEDTLPDGFYELEREDYDA